MERGVSLPPQAFYPIRFAVVAAILILVARPYIPLRASSPWASIGMGILVFGIWITPDLLFSYRHYWLFENPLTGPAASSLPAAIQRNLVFLLIRAVGSTVLVPILEELFWRGWMMRWLIHLNFLKVPMGQYAPSSFWIVAVLFASEHGPYWEVGLVAGVLYNWWLIRTRNLADCILAHAVTNGLLSVYVVATGQWQYWL